MKHPVQNALSRVIKKKKDLNFFEASYWQYFRSYLHVKSYISFTRCYSSIESAEWLVDTVP